MARSLEASWIWNWAGLEKSCLGTLSNETVTGQRSGINRNVNYLHLNVVYTKSEFPRDRIIVIHHGGDDRVKGTSHC